MFISIYLKFAVAAFPEIFVINTIVILIIFQVLITELMNTSSIFTGKHLSLHLTDPGFSTLMQLLALKNDLINSQYIPLYSNFFYLFFSIYFNLNVR